MPTGPNRNLLPSLVDLLPESKMTLLLNASRPLAFGNGEVIATRGDDHRGLFLIRKGSVQIGTMGKDGEYLTTTILGAGQSYGEPTLFADMPNMRDLMAIGPVTIAFIPVDVMQEILVTEPEICRALLMIQSIRLQSAMDMLDDVRRLPVLVLVAKAILVFALAARHDAQNPDQHNFEINQDELSMFIGYSRVSVNKAIAELRKEGLVDSGYGTLNIPDLPKLQQWVEARLQTTPSQTLLYALKKNINT